MLMMIQTGSTGLLLAQLFLSFFPIGAGNDDRKEENKKSITSRPPE
jgi:hypothetical protein